MKFFQTNFKDLLEIRLKCLECKQLQNLKLASESFHLRDAQNSASVPAVSQADFSRIPAS